MAKKPRRFFNRHRFFVLSNTLFIRSKFAKQSATQNRWADFNRERRRHIKIWQVFICWKMPHILRYRRVRLGILRLALRESNPFGLKWKTACLTALKKLDNSLIACTFSPCNPTCFLIWNCSHLRANKSVENFFELWRRQLKNFQDKGRTKARGFIVLRQMCSIPVRLSKIN